MDGVCIDTNIDDDRLPTAVTAVDGEQNVSPTCLMIQFLYSFFWCPLRASNSDSHR